MALEDSEHRLVRVQKDFSGISMDAQGNISLSRVGDTTRNTMHFCMDGIVASHEMGDWDDAGIMIVVDPGEMTAPCSGARLEDTWYHCANDGKLNVGKATVFVPEGVDVLSGLSVMRYPVGERAKTLERFLGQTGISMLEIGRNDVRGMSYGDYQGFSKAFAWKYGNGGPSVMDSHYHSFDASLERMSGRLELILDRMEYEGDTLINSCNDGDREAWKVAKEEGQSYLPAIDEYLRDNPEMASHAGLHFMCVADSIEASIKRAENLGEKYQSRFGLMDSTDQIVLQGVGFDEMWKAIESDRSDLLLDMCVIQEWPGISKENQVIGEVKEIFEDEIRRMHREVFAERA